MLTDQEIMPDQLVNGSGSVHEMEGTIDIEAEQESIDLDLTGLESEEIEHINEVILQDRSLLDEYHERNKRIDEITDEATTTIEMNNVDSGDVFCSVCSQKFSFFSCRKKICSLCENGICSECLYQFNNRTLLICKRCYLNCVREGTTGRWFNSLSKTNGRQRKAASFVISNSIRRAKNELMSNCKPERQSQRSQIEKETNADSVEVTPRKHIPTVPRKSYLEAKPSLSIGEEVTLDAVDGVDRSLNKEIANATMEVKYDSHRNSHSNTPSNLGYMTSLSTSAMSIASETDESYRTNIPVSGEIFFAMFYVEATKSLNIYVDQCRGIAVADRRRRRTDPYIKTYLLPDKTRISKKKTTIKKITMNPVFKETLVYTIGKEDLLSRTLSISAWHKSSFIKYNIFLGEVQLALSDADLSSKDCQWHQFHDKKRYSSKSAMIFKGELQIKLKFKAGSRKDSKGTLHVLIESAKRLESDHSNLNVYVKGYLLPDKSQKSKRKTLVCKNSINPTWNYSLHFPEVAFNELQDRSLELSVCHHSKLQGSEFLGGVRLNLGLGIHSSQHVQWMDAQGAEKEAWEKFLANPTEFTEANLCLRSNLDF